MMTLNFGAHEDFEFDIAALDPPARQHLREPLRADDTLTEISRVVPVKAAREHDLEKQPILVEPGRSNNDATMRESPVSPKVPAGKKHDARVVRIAGSGRAECHTDTA